MMNALFKLLVLTAGVYGELFSDEDNARLPSLFHLDDHDRCLHQKDGLYCLGVFELSPVEPSPVYEYIKEYSSNPFAFNRSRLHRGYCVSARCPSTERNATLRFERCVDERAKRYALSARILTLQYCTTQKQHKMKVEQPPDSAQELFLQVVWAILVLNFVGTLYDVGTGDREKKNGIIMAWSIRANWRRLTATYDDGDSRLKDLQPIQGIRLLAMLFIICAHAFGSQHMYYVMNPGYLENMSQHYDGILLANGSSLVQFFVALTSFLTTYYLLLYSRTNELNFLMLPALMLKRIIRIAPVHLLLVGYAATWWPHSCSGALSATIAENSDFCRRNFWAYTFLLHNTVEPINNCLGTTWYLPVDMHMFMLACVLTIVMYRRRHQALRMYGALFIISSLACGVVCYANDWTPFIHFSVPETMRNIFKEVESYEAFYTASLSLLPACFLGLFTAHLHYELQEKNYNYNENKWLKHIQNWALPAVIMWTTLTGKAIQLYQWPLVAAASITLDRQIFCIILLSLVFGVINFDGPVRRFFGWRGWRVPARLCLPVMMGHLLINTAVSARPAVYHTSGFELSLEFLVVLSSSFIIAIPINLLVETPVQKFFSQFI